MSNLSKEQVIAVINGNSREAIIAKIPFGVMLNLYSTLTGKNAPDTLDTVDKMVDELKRLSSESAMVSEPVHPVSEAPSGTTSQESQAGAARATEDAQHKMEVAAAVETPQVTYPETKTPEFSQSRFTGQYVTLQVNRELRSNLQEVINKLNDFKFELNHKEDKEVLDSTIKILSDKINSLQS